MAHPKETRDAVRRAYVYDRLSLEVSALKAGVSYATAARWKGQSAKDLSLIHISRCRRAGRGYAQAERT